VFDKIKGQCGFGPKAPIALKIVETPKSSSLGGVASVQVRGQFACGLYESREDSNGTFTEVITIDSDLAKNPTNLVATLAHELAHALHGRTIKPVDVDPILYELFTDLTAIYLGYGVFLANSRFEFSQFQNANSQGWQARGAGYLPEADMIMGLAIFMKIKGLEPEMAGSFLKPRLKKMLPKAFKQLSKYEAEIDFLKDLKPVK